LIKIGYLNDPFEVLEASIDGKKIPYIKFILTSKEDKNIKFTAYFYPIDNNCYEVKYYL
jgi:hypothetical protein